MPRGPLRPGRGPGCAGSRWRATRSIADNLHPVANPALDAEGNIYVTFSGARGQKVPVSLFKLDTSYTMKPFSTALVSPTGLAVDREGVLYVSSRQDGTVYRVLTNGTAAPYAEGMGVATGIDPPACPVPAPPSVRRGRAAPGPHPRDGS